MASAAAGSRPVPTSDVTALSRDRERPPDEAEEPDDESSSSSSCRYDFVGSASLRSGRVYSPRYPRNFSPHVDCVYRLRAADTQQHELEKVFVSLLSVKLGEPPPQPHPSRRTSR